MADIDVSLGPYKLNEYQVSVWTTIDDYLKSSESLEAAVSSLAIPVETDFTNGGHTGGGYVEGYAIEDEDNTPDIAELYATILRYARTIPWDDAPSQSRLVKLLTTLFTRSEPTPPAGYENAVLWKGHWFDSEVRDEWNFKPSEKGYRGQSLAEEKVQWTNLNAFLARVAVAVPECNWVYGIWALRELESNEIDLDLKIPAAAVWMLIAGEKIHEAVQKQESNPSMKTNDPIKETSIERWHGWEKIFLRITSSDEDVSDETRRIAGEAAKRF